MSDAFWIALFSGMPGIIAAIAAGLVAWSQVRLAAKVEVIHKATNSMKDALVAAAKVKGHAEGVAEERAKDDQKGSIKT